ncbi:hypothetical protein Ocin01_11294 [Orchesella cincta]|uniref:Uncharacterized protein n=1 Tax=Orchesella cincta TaxID=48709 RepID=A0A1D2MR32_ORCCI|nr:hypothetical protein Ocin01_11294 [Orchesella cincta]
MILVTKIAAAAITMPEEEELHVSRLGGEILCCATGNSSSSCRPPSYYACQMYEMTQTNAGSCNNNNVMDDDEYNTRRFKTNELMPSCGPGVDNSRSRPTSHWVAGGGGGGNFGECEDDSTSNFVPKLETLPARRDDYETSYALSGGGSSKKKRKSSDGSAKRKKTSLSNNSEEHGMASAEKAKRDEKKESKKKKKKHEDTDYDVSKNPTASHATTKATASRATTASKNTASHATTLADPDEEKEAEGQSRMIDDGIDDVDTIIHGLDFQD